MHSLPSWRVHNGAITHSSGGFFTVEGRCADTALNPSTLGAQPVFHQPEDGLLCLAIAIFGATPFALVQFVPEPGLPGGVGIGPTIQATASNMRRAHGGAPPPMVDQLAAATQTAVCDALLSDRRGWFAGKRNRHLIVTVAPLALRPGNDRFRWVPLSDLRELVHLPLTINAQLRSVLACLSQSQWDSAFWNSLDRHHPIGGVPTGAAATTPPANALAGPRYDTAVHTVPIGRIPQWTLGHSLTCDDANRYSIVGAFCSAPDREVAAWDQPLARAAWPGLVCLVTAAGAQRQYLVRDEVDICGPTTRLTYPTAMETRPTDLKGRGLSQLRDLGSLDASIVHLSLQHEEGGRFWDDTEVHAIIEVPQVFEAPLGTEWIDDRELETRITSGRAASELRSIAALRHRGCHAGRTAPLEDLIGQLGHDQGIVEVGQVIS